MFLFGEGLFALSEVGGAEAVEDLDVLVDGLDGRVGGEEVKKTGLDEVLGDGLKGSGGIGRGAELGFEFPGLLGLHGFLFELEGLCVSLFEAEEAAGTGFEVQADGFWKAKGFSDVIEEVAFQDEFIDDPLFFGREVVDGAAAVEAMAEVFGGFAK